MESIEEERLINRDKRREKQKTKKMKTVRYHRSTPTLVEKGSQSSFNIQSSETDLNNSFDYGNSTRFNDPPLFFFLNPKSGSQLGKSILYFASSLKSSQNNDNYGFNKIVVQNILEGDLISISCVFINILVNEQVEEACMFLKSLLSSANYSSSNKIKVLIGGGDGTVLSVIKVLIKNHVPVSELAFAPVPLGTGNDLSNALGFGGTVFVEEDEFSLFDLLFMYKNSEECKIDIWRTELKVEDRKGKVCDIDGYKEKEYVEKDEYGKIVPVKVFYKSFINYCSIGYEARVGFSFEKIRSTNRVMNKWIYFYKAAKKYLCFCKRKKTLKNLIYAFQTGDAVNYNSKQKNSIFKMGTDNILYQPGGKSSSKIVLNGDPVSIVCQNINYYLGGSKDTWKNSVSFGLTADENISEEEKESFVSSMNSEQRYDDSKLEFLTFESVIKLGLENIYTGNANKIYHGEAPVKIVFRKKVKDKVYLNVDGEYFRVYRPEYIKIEKETGICPSGQLSFLRRGGRY